MKTPKRLQGDAKAKWIELADTFDLTNPLEVELAIQYCEQHALYLRAIAEIAKADDLAVMSSNGAYCPHSGIKIQSQAIDQMRRLYTLLKPNIKKETDTKDPFKLDAVLSL
jgi:phage terminase small subunit